MAQTDNYKRTGNAGGMDTESAFEDIDPRDAVSRVNLRNVGTKGQELGYDTNIESTIELSGSLLPGINSVIGGGKFDDVGEIVGFRYNSAGNCQIILYSNATNTYSVIYTDITDSGGATLLPLNPQNQVTAILINKTYLIWWAKDLEVGYCNLQTLAAGDYGPTVIWEDLSLLKPQNMAPIVPVPNATSPDVITSGYGSDLGQPANLLFSKLPQFLVYGINADFNYSAPGTRGKRFTPYQENTPTLGAAVSQNNYIVVAVQLWSTRLVTINVAMQFDDSGQFQIIKSVDVAYIKSLPNTQVDVSTEIHEAYDPGTSTYYFTFYNNTVTIPVDSNFTDLLYDVIWPANAGALLNGNIPALGDWKMLYPRPVTPVTVAGVGYNPNIAIPANTYPDPLTAGPSFPGASGSGAGNHRRNMWIILTGTPHTNDVVVIIDADIRNASSIRNFSYTVPIAQDGNLLAVVTSIAETLSGSYQTAPGGGYQIFWTDAPYFGLQTFSVELYFAGASVANSIPTMLDNCSVQTAIGWFDYKMRPMPVTTDNSNIVTLPSYAQQNGNATQLNFTINTTAAPAGAAFGQIMVTKPNVLKVLDVISTLVTFKGSWDARTNSPGLAINSGNIGDTYQITTPASPANLVVAGADYTNLGHNDTYNTGDYITNVGGTTGGAEAGQYYAVLPKTFGNLATAEGGILVFSLNSLSLLNAEYSQQGVSTNLVYDFAPGDRCTLHYWIASIGAVNTFSITPGTGYTNGTYTNVSLTGGTGTGAIGTVTVAGNVVTGVVITTAGSGYTVGDVLTGTVTGGTGWSLTIVSLVTNGNNFFNQPCVDLAVLGYDAGTYLVKVENSAAFTFNNGHIYYNGFQIDGRAIFMRLYSLAPQSATASTALNTTEWFEIGEPIPVVNGVITQTAFNISVGAYYKTRQFPDPIKPYTNPPIGVLATDLNYSDFYQSNYHSYGRVRTYYDVLEQSEQQALIITGQPYVLGSRINGLNRAYPAHIYGNNNGQTSSSKGGIQIMDQVGQELWVLQELGVFRIPVNEAYTVLNDELTGQSISSILLNNGRYDNENVGIGLTKAYCRRYSTMYFIDPNKSLPYRIVAGRIEPISGKMTKFFQNLLQLAYSQGKRINFYYSDYYEEAVLTIEADGGQLFFFPFTLADWNPFNSYVITPGDVSATPNGAHCTASYNGATGVVTYTPTPGYSGGDTAMFSFTPPGGSLTTINNCLNWIAGDTTVNPFSFIAITGQPLNTVEPSINNVTVSGPNIAVPISISGGSGQYSINGGAWTSAAGTTVAGDSIQVRLTTSASNSTSVSTTLTIGAQTGTFTATTLAAAAGNYSIYSQYNVGISAVANGTCSGTPVFAGFPMSNGQRIYAAYTTTGGAGLTVKVTGTGTPSFPGHTYLALLVGGVQVSSVLYTGPNDYFLTFTGTVNDPTTIQIICLTM